MNAIRFFSFVLRCLFFGLLCAGITNVYAAAENTGANGLPAPIATEDRQIKNLALQDTFENPFGMRFVRIEPGTFSMGSPQDEPGRENDERLHEVKLTRVFFMQAHEVTNEQFVLFANDMNRLGELAQSWFQTHAQDKDSRIRRDRTDYGVEDGYETYPVTEVSWQGAMAFAAWLSDKTGHEYALPTEAQWEYACRAFTHTRFFWGTEVDCSNMMYENSTAGEDDDELADCVAYVKRSDLKPNNPAPVGSYPPNPWKIHDMHGNVWEWCQDIYDEYPEIEAVDPTGGIFGDFRVIRGGSWENSASTCRSANRNSEDPATRNGSIGFRVICYP